VLQANVGILQNNLNSPVSPRLKQAWEEEIAGLRAEIERVRHDLGASVRLFLQSVFPADDAMMQDAFSEEIGAFDPTLVHTFDMFMRVSELAETFTPDQLEAMAERLSRIEIFSNVSLANLENLSRAISVQSYDDGYMLFDQGDDGDAMYLIEEGNINIFSHDKIRQETSLLRTFKPGDVVGEFSLLDGRPRSARAIAGGPVRVLMLQREVFSMFIRSRPQVVLAMLQYLADKARYTTQAVETAMACITRITQGQYDITAAAPVSDETLELEPSEISAETSVLVGTAFSKAAATLHEREQSIRTGQAGA
jgi:CRP-like cAMP-binding protein